MDFTQISNSLDFLVMQNSETYRRNSISCRFSLGCRSLLWRNSAYHPAFQGIDDGFHGLVPWNLIGVIKTVNWWIILDLIHQLSQSMLINAYLLAISFIFLCIESYSSSEVIPKDDGACSLKCLFCFFLIFETYIVLGLRSSIISLCPIFISQLRSGSNHCFSMEL